jgi:hypothetical protein
MHIGLHLSEVKRLAVSDFFGDQIVEALDRVSLELQNVPSLGRFEQVDCYTIERATKVTAMRLDTKLSPGLRVHFKDRSARSTKVLNQPSLFKLAGFKQTKKTPRMPGTRHPSKVVPDRTLALLANQ